MDGHHLLDNVFKNIRLSVFESLTACNLVLIFDNETQKYNFFVFGSPV